MLRKLKKWFPFIFSIEAPLYNKVVPHQQKMFQFKKKDSAFDTYLKWTKLGIIKWKQLDICNYECEVINTKIEMVPCSKYFVIHQEHGETIIRQENGLYPTISTLYNNVVFNCEPS